MQILKSYKTVFLMALLSFVLTSITTAVSAQSVKWDENGHYYEVINTSINWHDAKLAAETLGGHLVTITSAQENQWITDTFGATVLHYHWIGGFQLPGSAEPGGGWSWVTGELWVYDNWWPYGEPNNSWNTEDAVVFDHGEVLDNGKSWNDLTNTWVTRGYVVEWEQVARNVYIDIKPGSDPNCFNINDHGVIPVAIFGATDFDVGNIDPDTLLLSALKVRLRGNKGPLCSIEDVNGDAEPDLVCKFEDDSTNWEPDDTTATLTGELLDGTSIQGSDSICVVP